MMNLRVKFPHPNLHTGGKNSSHLALLAGSSWIRGLVSSLLELMWLEGWAGSSWSLTQIQGSLKKKMHFLPDSERENLERWLFRADLNTLEETWRMVLASLWSCSHWLFLPLQADPGAGNPSGLLLLLWLWETQCRNCRFSPGQVSIITPLPLIFSSFSRSSADSGQRCVATDLTPWKCEWDLEHRGLDNARIISSAGCRVYWFLHDPLTRWAQADKVKKKNGCQQRNAKQSQMCESGTAWEGD